MIITSRLSGTRPLGVFFEIDRPARHIAWKVNNTDFYVGQIMAYVFTDVGSHIVQAVVTDDLGTVVEEVVIDVKFHIGPLLYVANNGDDSAGGDKNHPLKTILSAVNRASPGTKIYIRRGDKFDIPNWLPLKQPSIYLRTYGTGLKPVIQRGFFYCLADDIRFQGLRFEGPTHAIMFAQQTKDHIIYNCEITNASIGVKLNDSNVSLPDVAKNIVIAGCDIHHIQYYGVYGKVDGLAFLNSKVREYSASHHGIRVASGQRFVMNKSYITSSNPVFSYTALTIRGAGDGTAFIKATISENVFDRECSSSPQNDTFDEDIFNIEWYNNTFNHTPFTHSGYALTCLGKNIKIVGNTFLHWGIAIYLRSKHVGKIAEDILIRGNKHLADKSVNQGHYFITGKGDNVKCLDNLHESHTFAKWSKVVSFNGTLENARNYYNVVRSSNLPLFQINGQDLNMLTGWIKFGTGNINNIPSWLHK